MAQVEYQNASKLRITTNEQMKSSLVDAMLSAEEHEEAMKSKGRATRFVRSTKYSDTIGHNFRIMQSLQTAAENCKNS